MRYLKTFEREHMTSYAERVKIGDVLICIDSDSFSSDYKLILGDEYKVLFIHKPEPEHTKFYYFDIEHINTGNKLMGRGAILFKPEYFDNIKKYNL